MIPHLNKEIRKIGSTVCPLHNVYLNSVKNVEKFVSIMGFSNFKHINKYYLEKHGFYKKKNMPVPRFELGASSL